MSLLACPFCEETNFDLVGLKYHLRFYCDAFDSTPELGPRMLTGAEIKHLTADAENDGPVINRNPQRGA
jgi:hypothetical protein